MMDSSRGGRFAAGNCEELMRLMLAACVSGGSTFRRNILDEARNPVLAAPMEIGIDKAKIVAHCRRLEKSETRVRLLFTLILICTVGIWLLFKGEDDVYLGVGLILAAIAAALLGAVRQIDQYNLLKQFTSRNYDSRHNTEVSPEPEDGRCVGTQNQNVVVFRGFSPLEFAGTPLGGWSFAIDTEKRTADATGGKDSPLSIAALEGRVKKAILENNPAIECRDLLLVHGCDADILPQHFRNEGPSNLSIFAGMPKIGEGGNRIDTLTTVADPPVSAPQVELDLDTLLGTERKFPNLARRHLWFANTTWGGDLTLSHMLRVSLVGRILYIEVGRRLLTPVGTSFREVDNLCGTSRESTSALLFGMFAGPFHVLIQPLLLLGAGRLDQSVRKWRKAIKESPRFNYGSETSLRRSVMSENYAHYGQREDVECQTQSFNKIVIEELASYLEECGIDTTDIRNKEMTIYNSGILVQSGDVTAQTLAVGQAAVAQTTTVAQPNTRRAVAGSNKGGVE